jgi:hypothetical protein
MTGVRVSGLMEYSVAASPAHSALTPESFTTLAHFSV